MANLTLRNVDDDLIDDLKKLTGKGAASQALIVAGEIALSEREWRIRLQDRIDELQERLKHKEQLMSNLDGLCRQILERTGQTDLDDTSHRTVRVSRPSLFPSD